MGIISRAQGLTEENALETLGFLPSAQQRVAMTNMRDVIKSNTSPSLTEEMIAANANAANERYILQNSVGAPERVMRPDGLTYTAESEAQYDEWWNNQRQASNQAFAGAYATMFGGASEGQPLTPYQQAYLEYINGRATARDLAKADGHEVAPAPQIQEEEAPLSFTERQWLNRAQQNRAEPELPPAAADDTAIPPDETEELTIPEGGRAYTLPPNPYQYTTPGSDIRQTFDATANARYSETPDTTRLQQAGGGSGGSGGSRGSGGSGGAGGANGAGGASGATNAATSPRGWAQTGAIPGALPTTHPLGEHPGAPDIGTIGSFLKQFIPFNDTLTTKAVRVREEMDYIGSMFTSSTNDPKNWATLLRAFAQDPDNIAKGIDVSMLPGMETQINAAGNIAFDKAVINNTKTAPTKEIMRWGRTQLESLAYLVEQPVEIGNATRPMNAVEFKQLWTNTIQNIASDWYGAGIDNPLTEKINSAASVNRRLQATALNVAPGVWAINAIDANYKQLLEGYGSGMATPDLIARMQTRTGGVGTTARVEAAIENKVAGSSIYLGYQGRSTYYDATAGFANMLGYTIDADQLQYSRMATPAERAGQAIVNTMAQIDEAGSRMWTGNKHLVGSGDTIGFGESANYMRTFAAGEQSFIDNYGAEWFADTIAKMRADTSLDQDVVTAIVDEISRSGTTTSRADFAGKLDRTIRSAGGQPRNYAKYTGGGLLQDQDTLYNAAGRSGFAGAENVVLEPSHQTNFDSWLGNFFAYPYFGTRTAWNWALRSIRDPRTLAYYQRWEKAARVRSETDEDLPQRYDGTLPITLPFIGEVNMPNIFGVATGIDKLRPNTNAEDLPGQFNLRPSMLTDVLTTGNLNVIPQDLLPIGGLAINTANAFGADLDLGPWAPKTEEYTYARMLGTMAYADPKNPILASMALMASQVAFDNQWNVPADQRKDLPNDAYTLYGQAKQATAQQSAFTGWARYLLGASIKPAVDPREELAGQTSNQIRTVGIGGMDAGNPYSSWNLSNYMTELFPAAAVWAARNQSYPEQQQMDPLTASEPADRWMWGDAHPSDDQLYPTDGTPAPQPIARLWNTLPSLKLDSDKQPTWWTQPDWNMTKGALLNSATDSRSSKVETKDDTALYMLQDPKTGLIRYVGQTVSPSKRYVQHIEDFNDLGFGHPKGIWTAEMLRAGTYPNMFVFDWVSGGTLDKKVIDPVDKAEQAWIGYLAYGQDSRMGATTNVQIPDYATWLTLLAELNLTPEKMRAQMDIMSKNWEPIQLADKPNLKRSPFPAFPEEVMGAGTTDYYPDESAWQWIKDEKNQNQPAAMDYGKANFALWLENAGPKSQQILNDLDIYDWGGLSRANPKELIAKGVPESDAYNWINQANLTLLVTNAKDPLPPPIAPRETPAITPTAGITATSAITPTTPISTTMPATSPAPATTPAQPTSEVPPYQGGYGYMGVIAPLSLPVDQMLQAASTATAVTAAAAAAPNQNPTDNWLYQHVDSTLYLAQLAASKMGIGPEPLPPAHITRQRAAEEQARLAAIPQPTLKTSTMAGSWNPRNDVTDEAPVPAAQGVTTLPRGVESKGSSPGTTWTPTTSQPIPLGDGQGFQTFQQVVSTGTISPRVSPLVAQRSQQLGIDPNLAQAVLNVESGGQGFVDDRLKIRFEPDVFNNQFLKNDEQFGQYFSTEPGKYDSQKFRTGPDQPWQNIHASQANEYAALNVASQMMIPNAKGVPTLASTQAIASTAMGAAQIMGFNYRTAGYESPEGMMADYAKGQDRQTESFFTYLDKSGKIDLLKQPSLGEFATAYNGPGLRDIYTQRITKEYASLVSAQQPDLNLQRAYPLMQINAPATTVLGNVWNAAQQMITTAAANQQTGNTTPKPYTLVNPMAEAGIDFTAWLKSGDWIPPYLRQYLAPELAGAVGAEATRRAYKDVDSDGSIGPGQTSDTYFYIPGWRPTGKPGEQIFLPTLPDGRKLWVPQNMMDIREDAPGGDWLNNPQYDPNNPEGSLARIIEKYGQPVPVQLSELNSQPAYIDRPDMTSYDKPEIFGAGQNPLMYDPFGIGGPGAGYTGAPGGQNMGPFGAAATIAGQPTLMLPFRYSDKYKVTQRFGENPDQYSPFGLAGHEGMDWAVPAGTQLTAPIGGKVTEAGWNDLYGNYVKIENEYGQTALIAHMGVDQQNSGIGVRVNQYVAAGQPIGLSGNTGNSTGPHVHMNYSIAGGEAPEGMGGWMDPEKYMMDMGDASPNGWYWSDIPGLSPTQIGALVAAGYRSIDAIEKAIAEKGLEAVAADLDQNALTNKLVDAQKGWDIITLATQQENMGKRPPTEATAPTVNPKERLLTPLRGRPHRRTDTGKRRRAKTSRLRLHGTGTRHTTPPTSS